MLKQPNQAAWKTLINTSTLRLILVTDIRAAAPQQLDCSSTKTGLKSLPPQLLQAKSKHILVYNPECLTRTYKLRELLFDIWRIHFPPPLFKMESLLFKKEPILNFCTKKTYEKIASNKHVASYCSTLRHSSCLDLFHYFQHICQNDQDLSRKFKRPLQFCLYKVLKRS